MIDNSTKERIVEQLNNYCAKAGSANKASNQLNISGATISKMLSNKWADIADDMWRKLSKSLGFKIDEMWKHADTTPYMALSGLFDDARMHANVYGITCQPGSGKTYTLDRYRRQHPNVWYVKCQRHTPETTFLYDLLRSAGKVSNAKGIQLLLSLVNNQVNRTESPLIIIDEIEKVKNDTLFLLIDLYNLVHHKCGIILLGTPNLKNRVDNGVARGFMCYNELYSRIGGQFVELPAPSVKDGAGIIRANGFDDEIAINSILNDSKVAEMGCIDLRRVERLVHKERLTQPQ